MSDDAGGSPSAARGFGSASMQSVRRCGPTSIQHRGLRSARYPRLPIREMRNVPQATRSRRWSDSRLGGARLPTGQAGPQPAALPLRDAMAPLSGCTRGHMTQSAASI